MKLGFLLPNLGGSQAAFRLIYNTNQIYPQTINVDVVGFYETAVKPCFPPRFATMNIADAWNYNGNIIATNLSTAKKILKFPNVKKRFFYIYDLEWVSIQLKEYEILAEIYQNSQLTLLTRSDNHAKCIEDAWNRSVTNIVPDFNIDKFITLIN